MKDYQYHIFSPYRVCTLGAHVDHQHGLVTGFATREDVVSLLGEPAKTRTLDAKAAAAEMLESGESLIYEEGHLLEMHFNEAGTLSAVILRTAMPEDLYR